MSVLSVASHFKGFGDGPVLVHSDSLNTLRLVPRTRNLDELGEAHYRRICDISEGRDIWMPTFNYAFPKSKLYNVQKDPSEVGLISEWFRRHSEWRTTTPIFNFAGTGKYPEPGRETKALIDPFGPASTFAELVQLDGSILWYGAPFSAATIMHHVESFGIGPLYRYDKLFDGQVNSEKHVIACQLKYHVRPLNGPITYDWEKLTPEALSAGVLKKIVLEEDADILVADARELCAFWQARYVEDPYYFLDHESRKWIEPIIQNLGRRVKITDFEKEYYAQPV